MLFLTQCLICQNAATYIGEPLERLGEEAERRLDIAQSNLYNAIYSFRRRHDDLNHSSRRYANRLKYYASNVRQDTFDLHFGFIFALAQNSRNFCLSSPKRALFWGFSRR